MNILLAILCVFLFGLTAPFTRSAALETSAEAVILLRILGAALVCAAYLIYDRWLPPKKAWFGIFKAALGTVIGFNSLLGFGMKLVPSGHAAVALAALPMASAIYSVVRDRLNPGIKFWLFAIIGTSLSIGFFFFLNVQSLHRGDIFLILAVFAAAFGYIEGGRVSREFGGARVMSWAVMLTLPIVVPVSLYYFKHYPESLDGLSSTGWFSIGYLALISQSLGMFLWFRVLAIGPMEKVALVQLLQPFFTLFGAIFLLHESVTVGTWIIAILVAGCVFTSNREKNRVF